ncbi:Protein of unknown function [Gryllus bimaculatus]|nr:Protein of unknown function [Gryllus bimaculatus]
MHLKIKLLSSDSLKNLKPFVSVLCELPVCYYFGVSISIINKYSLLNEVKLINFFCYKFLCVTRLH